MRGLIRRAAVAAGTAVVVLGAGMGGAAARTGPAVLVFHPSQFDYGQVTVGQGSVQTFTLANTGGRGSGALTVRLSGSEAFTITADTCRASLAPGKTCTVRVRFAPTAAGTVTATLQAANRNRAATASDALTGTGQGIGQAVGHIYWADQGNGTINEAPLAGGPVTTLATGQDDPAGVAVDSSYVYWADRGNGTINEAPLAGGPATTLVTGQDDPAGVAVGGSAPAQVYWASHGDSAIYELRNGRSFPLLTAHVDKPVGVAVNSTRVCWANQNGSIGEAPLPDVRNPGFVATGQNGPAGVAVDSSNVYWANQGNGTINEAPLAGGPPTTLVTGQVEPWGVAVDSSQIYWANQAGGAINEAPLAGGTPTTLVSGQSQPTGVAVGP